MRCHLSSLHTQTLGRNCETNYGKSFKWDRGGESYFTSPQCEDPSKDCVQRSTTNRMINTHTFTFLMSGCQSRSLMLNHILSVRGLKQTYFPLLPGRIDGGCHQNAVKLKEVYQRVFAAGHAPYTLSLSYPYIRSASCNIVTNIYFPWFLLMLW